MITRTKISAVRANSFVVLEQFIVFFLVIRNSSNKRRIGGAALIRGRRLLTFLSQMRRLFEGGAYSSKYGNPQNVFCQDVSLFHAEQNGAKFLVAWSKLEFSLNFLNTVLLPHKGGERKTGTGDVKTGH